MHSNSPSKNISTPQSQTAPEKKHPERFLFFHQKPMDPEIFLNLFPEGVDLYDLPSCELCRSTLAESQIERIRQIDVYLRLHESELKTISGKIRKKAEKWLKKYLFSSIEAHFLGALKEAQTYHQKLQEKSIPSYPQFCYCTQCKTQVEDWKEKRLEQVRAVARKFDIRNKDVDSFSSYCLHHPQESPTSLLFPYWEETPKGKKFFLEALQKLLKRPVLAPLLKKYTLPSTSMNALLQKFPETLTKGLVKELLKTPTHAEWFAQIAPDMEAYMAQFAQDNPDLVHIELERSELERRLNLATNMKSPHLFYKKARQSYRDIIFHIGPTNAGKTYHAFEALRRAKDGQYLAPLRLLAQEGQDKLAQHSVRTSLITGEERDLVPEATHISSTIEMADLNHPKEIAVIDEIQMINDKDRGWAWTRALLGFPAKEIHLCGNEEAVPIVETLVQICGDFLTKKYYKRLTPLRVTEHPVPLEKLEPGDAVIAFSRRALHELKYALKQRGFLTSMVYGALPPEVRRSQAALFNARKNEILLATDAIGMGLNLNINRIIFWELTKHYNLQVYDLTPAEILQIGGRAGRYGYHDIGYVSGVNHHLHRKIQDAFESSVTPNEKMRAGLKPEFTHIQALQEAAGYGDLPALLLEFRRRATTDRSVYQLCRMDDMIELAQLTHPAMPLEERFLFCCAPVDMRCTLPIQLFQQMVHARAQKSVLPLVLKAPKFQKKDPDEENVILQVFEERIKTIDVYLWLAYRYPETFPSLEDGIKQRVELSTQISEILAQTRPKEKRKHKQKRF